MAASSSPKVKRKAESSICVATITTTTADATLLARPRSPMKSDCFPTTDAPTTACERRMAHILGEAQRREAASEAQRREVGSAALVLAELSEAAESSSVPSVQ